MEPNSIPEQPNVKKENVSDFDLESVVISPEVYQTLQRVQIRHPDIALEALVAQRDRSIGQRYIQNLGEDVDAAKVWEALDRFLNTNAGAVDIWLGERVPLETLMRDEGGSIEDIDIDRHMKEREIPYIRKAFAEQPIILLDLLQGVKTEAAEISALSGLPEDQVQKISATIDKMIGDNTAAEEKTKEILKRLKGK